MPLKKSTGNMYPWVTHMHTHLGGECPHKCGYCYVQTNPYGVHPRYKGTVRLIRSELGVNYSNKWWDEKDKTWKTEKIIFIEHMGDLFAEGVSSNLSEPVLIHCRIHPENEYVFQTKNPKRAWIFLSQFPPKFMMGTTIETNREYKDTQAPPTQERYEGMLPFREKGIATFVTLEPIMDFDVDTLYNWLVRIDPDFVNIGADSKECNLSEPPKEKVKELIQALEENTEVKVKSNLKRLIQEHPERRGR